MLEIKETFNTNLKKLGTTLKIDKFIIYNSSSPIYTSTEVFGLYDAEEKVIKIFLDLTNLELNITGNTKIEYYCTNTLAFTISGISLYVSGRNLFNVKLDSDTKANIVFSGIDEDTDFLESVGNYRGINIVTEKSDDKLVTVDSYNTFLLNQTSKGDQRTPYLDYTGRRVENSYIVKTYSDITLDCVGLNKNMEIPTRFDLDYKGGVIDFFGKALCKEYKVIEGDEELIGEYYVSLNEIPGIKLEKTELKSTNLISSIDNLKVTFNKCLEYNQQENLKGDSLSLLELEDMYQKATIKAVVNFYNINGVLISVKSNDVLLTFSREKPNFSIISESTEYDEAGIPLYIFDSNVAYIIEDDDLGANDSNNIQSCPTKHSFTIRVQGVSSEYTTDDIELVTENDEIWKTYFSEPTIEPVSGENYTDYNISFTALKTNTGDYKWYPLVDKNSKLIKSTIKFKDSFSYDFYLIQKANLKPFSLFYNGSRINKIELPNNEETSFEFKPVIRKNTDDLGSWWKIRKITNKKVSVEEEYGEFDENNIILNTESIQVNSVFPIDLGEIEISRICNAEKLCPTDYWKIEAYSSTNKYNIIHKGLEPYIKLYEEVEEPINNNPHYTELTNEINVFGINVYKYVVRSNAPFLCTVSSKDDSIVLLDERNNRVSKLYSERYNEDDVYGEGRIYIYLLLKEKNPNSVGILGRLNIKILDSENYIETQNYNYLLSTNFTIKENKVTSKLININDKDFVFVDYEQTENYKGVKFTSTTTPKITEVSKNSSYEVINVSDCIIVANRVYGYLYHYVPAALSKKSSLKYPSPLLKELTIEDQSNNKLEYKLFPKRLDPDVIILSDNNGIFNSSGKLVIEVKSRYELNKDDIKINPNQTFNQISYSGIYDSLTNTNTSARGSNDCLVEFDENEDGGGFENTGIDSTDNYHKYKISLKTKTNSSSGRLGQLVIISEIKEENLISPSEILEIEQDYINTYIAIPSKRTINLYKDYIYLSSDNDCVQADNSTWQTYNTEVTFYVSGLNDNETITSTSSISNLSGLSANFNQDDGIITVTLLNDFGSFDVNIITSANRSYSCTVRIDKLTKSIAYYRFQKSDNSFDDWNVKNITIPYYTNTLKFFAGLFKKTSNPIEGDSFDIPEVKFNEESIDETDNTNTFSNNLTNFKIKISTNNTEEVRSYTLKIDTTEIIITQLADSDILYNETTINFDKEGVYVPSNDSWVDDGNFVFKIKDGIGVNDIDKIEWVDDDKELIIKTASPVNDGSSFYYYNVLDEDGNPYFEINVGKYYYKYGIHQVFKSTESNQIFSGYLHIVSTNESEVYIQFIKEDPNNKGGIDFGGKKSSSGGVVIGSLFNPVLFENSSGEFTFDLTQGYDDFDWYYINSKVTIFEVNGFSRISRNDAVTFSNLTYSKEANRGIVKIPYSINSGYLNSKLYLIFEIATRRLLDSGVDIENNYKIYLKHDSDNSIVDPLILPDEPIVYNYTGSMTNEYKFKSKIDSSLLTLECSDSNLNITSLENIGTDGDYVIYKLNSSIFYTNYTNQIIERNILIKFESKTIGFINTKQEYGINTGTTVNIYINSNGTFIN